MRTTTSNIPATTTVNSGSIYGTGARATTGQVNFSNGYATTTPTYTTTTQNYVAPTYNTTSATRYVQPTTTYTTTNQGKIKLIKLSISQQPLFNKLEEYKIFSNQLQSPKFNELSM